MQEPLSKAPQCVGIIMDGNRRFARERGLPTMEGHKAGYEKAKDAASWCRDAGVKYLILYAFSNENWNRSPEEVSYLTEIFHTLVFNEGDKLRGEGGAVRFIGDLGRFGEEFEAKARELEATNPTDPVCTLVVALSYGGRQEIVHSVNEILKEKKSGEVTEADIAAHLFTRGIPDPDLIIRTSGEQRLSNFLPWQATYSELFFVSKHWPDFTKKDFEQILAEYAVRERRHGK